MVVRTDPQPIERTVGDVARAMEKLRAKNETQRKATKGRFNLFTVLRQEHDEAGLHTKYLVHLLDPSDQAESGHDCGGLFLDLFLKHVALKLRDSGEQDLADALGSLDSSKATVRGEVTVVTHPGKKGRLDIIISCPGWGTIVIENKVWAREQEEQLSRYSNYLHREGGDNKLLLYLTPEGGEANTTAGAEYGRISYRHEILSWLEDCLQATYQYVGINQSLQQYKHLVQAILGVHERAYMVDVVNILRQHAGIIPHLGTLQAAIEPLRKEAWKVFFDEVVQSIEQQSGGEFVLHPWEPTRPCEDHHVYVENANWAIATGGKFDLVLESCPDWVALYVGVATHRQNVPLSDTDKSALEQLRLTTEKENKFVVAKIHEQMPGWPIGRYGLLWREEFINQRNLPDYLDEKWRAAKAREVAANALEYIQYTIEKLEAARRARQTPTLEKP